MQRPYIFLSKFSHIAFMILILRRPDAFFKCVRAIMTVWMTYNERSRIFSKARNNSHAHICDERNRIFDLCITHIPNITSPYDVLFRRRNVLKIKRFRSLTFSLYARVRICIFLTYAHCVCMHSFIIYERIKSDYEKYIYTHMIKNKFDLYFFPTRQRFMTHCPNKSQSLFSSHYSFNFFNLTKRNGHNNSSRNFIV